MSYRCVIVSNPAHISTRSEQLVVETDERHTVPIEDISALMLESRRATLSAAALSLWRKTERRCSYATKSIYPAACCAIRAQPPATAARATR
ncbi:MAG: hypothetical protein ACLR7U_10810 [Ruthenibacterium lactatiformans]